VPALEGEAMTLLFAFGKSVLVLLGVLLLCRMPDWAFLGVAVPSILAGLTWVFMVAPQ
jgi:hypothetical protein